MDLLTLFATAIQDDADIANKKRRITRAVMTIARREVEAMVNEEFAPLGASDTSAN